MEPQTNIHSVMLSVTASEIDAQISKGDRVSDIEILPSGRFDAVFYANRPHPPFERQRAQFRVFSSAQELGEFAAHNSLRFIDLEYAVVNGAQVWAASMVGNLPTDREASKGAWWFINQSVADIARLQQETGARVVDIDPLGGGRYNILMTPNSGEDALASSIVYRLSWSKLRSKIFQIGGPAQRLLDIEPDDGGYTAIFVDSTDGIAWDIRINMPRRQVVQAARDGARIYDLERMPDGDGYMALIMNPVKRDLSAEDKRLEILAQAGFKGAPHGFFAAGAVRETFASFQQKVRFHPASAIKFMLAVYAMRQVERGAISLDTLISWDEPPCQSGRGMHRLDDSIRQMMQQSHPEATAGIMMHFGLDNIHRWAGDNGFHNSRIYNCGLRAWRWTLEEAAQMYQGAFDGTLLSPESAENLRGLMLHSDQLPPRIDIHQLAQDLGRASHIDQIVSSGRSVWKGGSGAGCPIDAQSCSPAIHVNNVNAELVWIPHWHDGGIIVRPTFFGWYVDLIRMDCAFKPQEQSWDQYYQTCPGHRAFNDSAQAMLSELYREAYTRALLTFPADPVQ